MTVENNLSEKKKGHPGVPRRPHGDQARNSNTVFDNEKSPWRGLSRCSRRPSRLNDRQRSNAGARMVLAVQTNRIMSGGWCLVARRGCGNHRCGHAWIDHHDCAWFASL